MNPSTPTTRSHTNGRYASTPVLMDPKGTIVFSTISRPNYGFDVFFVQLNHITVAIEDRLTDGCSVNFNAQFVDEDQSVVFVSERSRSRRIYLTRPGLPNLDWAALHSTEIDDKDKKITRLTLYEAVDYSPTVSKSRKFLVVASYGSRLWGGEFHELNMDIVVFPKSDLRMMTMIRVMARMMNQMLRAICPTIRWLRLIRTMKASSPSVRAKIADEIHFKIEIHGFESEIEIHGLYSLELPC
ncbi:hypothetical protein SLEP1_g52397 [Rubroshorea leprosula]|uniref:Uncharacterized protein n=1 Tax=Rubroshorea leprosula TaxID=152421 RepID=A0AAV5M9I3_9ROSI|nr:hypothetical protein SLEP1_g52397 [Rubroshorea leprosula]